MENSIGPICLFLLTSIEVSLGIWACLRYNVGKIAGHHRSGGQRSRDSVGTMLNVQFRFGVAVLALALLGAGAKATDEFRISINGRDQTYQYNNPNALLTDTLAGTNVYTALLKLGVDAADAISTGCANFSLLTVNFQWTDGGGFEIQQVVPSLNPPPVYPPGTYPSFLDFLQIQPCESQPLTDVAVIRGNMGLYVVHAGTGPFPRRFRTGSFTYCDEMLIYSPTLAQVEIPWTISGAVMAAESLGGDEITFGLSRLTMTASVGGQSSGTQSVEVRSVTTIPTEAGINQSGVLQITARPGWTSIPINAFGEAYTEVRAMGVGFFGLITSSATTAVDFPNSIRIGNVRRTGGGSLPTGFRAISANYPHHLTFQGTPVPVSGLVFGEINLSGFLGEYDGQVAEFTRFRNGVPIGTQTGVLSPGGRYAIQNSETLPYELLIRTRSGLWRSVGIINPASSRAVRKNATLINGDVDRDNEIGPSDFTQFSATFGRAQGDPGYNPSADFNGDDEVGPADFTILGQSFGQMGD